MSRVQSFAADMPSGLGANSAAISMLLVPTRSSGAFSQTQPPCIAVDTITAGNAAVGRSSIADSRNVCVPPPLVAGDADARRIDVGQARPRSRARARCSTSAGPCSLQPQHRVGVGEAFAVDDRLAVGVADHVVVKDDAAEAREVGAPFAWSG